MQQVDRDHDSLPLDEVKKLLSNAEKRLKAAASTNTFTNNLVKPIDFVSIPRVDSSCRHEILTTIFSDLN